MAIRVLAVEPHELCQPTILIRANPQPLLQHINQPPRDMSGMILERWGPKRKHPAIALLPPYESLQGVVPGNSVIVPTPKRATHHQLLLRPAVPRMLTPDFFGVELVRLDLAF